MYAWDSKASFVKQVTNQTPLLFRASLGKLISSSIIELKFENWVYHRLPLRPVLLETKLETLHG